MNSRSASRGFGHVETWVFDLDNTLYPHHLNLWQQVDERIRDYIARYLKVTLWHFDAGIDDRAWHGGG
jgi:putative hydrolase of the HAD superfamily